MADYFYGNVQFPAFALNQQPIRDAICLCVGFDEDDLDAPGGFETMGRVMEVDAGIVKISDDQARFGELETIEIALREHGIAYDAFSEAKYEFDAELRIFRPGMDAAAVMSCNDTGSVMVDLADVRQKVETARTKRNPQAQWAVLDAVIAPRIHERDPLSRYIKNTATAATS